MTTNNNPNYSKSQNTQKLQDSCSDIPPMQKLNIFGNQITNNKNFRDLVKKILIDHTLYQIPVDVFQLAKEENFEIFEHDDNDCSGYIYINPKEKLSIKGKEYGNKIISLRKSDSFERKRFTLAHELGHYYLDCGGKDTKIYAKRDEDIFLKPQDPNERRMNNFASELLMPYDMIEIYLQLIKEDFSNISVRDEAVIATLAKSFQTSKSATDVRISKFLQGI